MCVVRCGTHRRPTSASRRWKVIKALCCHWLSMAIDYSVVPRIARFLYELHSTHFIHIHSCLLIARHVCHWSEPRKTSGTWFSNILVTRNLSHWFVHMQVCHVIEECSDLCRCGTWRRLNVKRWLLLMIIHSAHLSLREECCSVVLSKSSRCQSGLQSRTFQCYILIFFPVASPQMKSACICCISFFRLLLSAFTVTIYCYYSGCEMVQILLAHWGC